VKLNSTRVPWNLQVFDVDHVLGLDFHTQLRHVVDRRTSLARIPGSFQVFDGYMLDLDLQARNR
jgi:hypothetical protein